jgi:hypothetical protein
MPTAARRAREMKRDAERRQAAEDAAALAAQAAEGSETDTAGTGTQTADLEWDAATHDDAEHGPGDERDASASTQATSDPVVDSAEARIVAGETTFEDEALALLGAHQPATPFGQWAADTDAHAEAHDEPADVGRSGRPLPGRRPGTPATPAAPAAPGSHPKVKVSERAPLLAAFAARHAGGTFTAADAAAELNCSAEVVGYTAKRPEVAALLSAQGMVMEGHRGTYTVSAPAGATTEPATEPATV